MTEQRRGLTEADETSDGLTTIVTAWSQRVSRRSALVKIGNLLFAVAGVELAGALVRVPVALATHNCSPCKYCYLEGYPCSCCGGTDSTCPSGCTAQGYWTGCCCNGLRYRMQDCCGGCPSCPGTCHYCTNAPPGTAYCTSGSYKCTLAYAYSTC